MAQIWKTKNFYYWRKLQVFINFSTFGEFYLVKKPKPWKESWMDLLGKGSDKNPKRVWHKSEKQIFFIIGENCKYSLIFQLLVIFLSKNIEILKKINVGIQWQRIQQRNMKISSKWKFNSLTKPLPLDANIDFSQDFCIFTK